MDNTLSKRSTGHNSEAETSGRTEGLRIMSGGLASNGGTGGHDEATTLPTTSSCQHLLLVAECPYGPTPRSGVALAVYPSGTIGNPNNYVPSHPEREELISASLEPCCFSQTTISDRPPPPSPIKSVFFLVFFLRRL